MFFFFNDTATTEIYTLSLHDALPISAGLRVLLEADRTARTTQATLVLAAPSGAVARSEEHTSELQSRLHLVCRLLLEKKKTLRSISRPFYRIYTRSQQEHTILNVLHH